jgi:NADH dehydrogenase/NADH:ubiquinone oxidoreductase subunit G
MNLQIQLRNQQSELERKEIRIVMAKLTIDNKIIEAPSGARLLDVARDNNFQIPTLCYHRDLSPTGNCRICVVEVQGQRFLQAACVTMVWDGMVVQTNSPRAVRSRKKNSRINVG